MATVVFDDSLALVGGTIYISPTEEPIRDGVVLIRGGKIAAVGGREVVQPSQTVETLDCSGLTITAGFWNSHVHFFERKWANAATIPAPEISRQLQDMLTRYGFTSVFDIGSMWENTRRLRDRIESGEVPGPRIRSTGEGLVPPGAAPSEQILNIMIQAAVREAHRLGKPVFVHPNSGAEVLTAVRSGVDVIAHTTPHSGPWDETILTAMKEHRVALTPTLTLWKYYLRHDRISTQEQIVKTAIGQLRAWLGAGGTVLFGTDLGAVDYDPSEEYALMSDAGMSFRQILDSLTTAPAERFGESKQSGRIAEGFHADLVVLKDIRALAVVQYTLREGKIIYRRMTA
jgi:imidazolonepropionase-like amidohydrolase